MTDRQLTEKSLSGHTSKMRVTPASIIGPRLLLILSTICLVVFGLVMVYSASFVEAFTNPDIADSSYIFRHQLQLVVVGLLAMTVATAWDYRKWNTLAAWIPWALVVFLLIWTLVDGNEELGGQRWVDILGFSLQASELAKPALVLIVAMLALKLHTNKVPTTLPWMIAAAIAVPIVLIAIQPDLGTVIIVSVGVLAVLFFAELPMKPLLFGLGFLATLGIALIRLAGFRMDRIDAWLDPEGHAAGAGYQIMNSFYAFADGGTTGVGLGMSHQKYLYLPQPQNDLIFPIIGEEFGLVGTVAVVIVFLVFLYAVYHIARDSSDIYGRIVAGSAGTLIGFQAFLNMLCTANLLPLTGKPLPFFSAGGSSIVVTLILVGLILNVSLHSKVQDAAEKKREELIILDGGRRGPRGGQRLEPEQPLRRQPAIAAVAKKMRRLRKQPAAAPAATAPAATAAAPRGSAQRLRKQSAGASAATAAAPRGSAQRLRKQPATATAAATRSTAQRLRKQPVSASVELAQVGPASHLRRPPVPASRLNANPALKLSPARYQASLRPVQSTSARVGQSASARSRQPANMFGATPASRFGDAPASRFGSTRGTRQ